MSILKTMLYIVFTVLLAMWLSFAVMGAWANYVMNSIKPSAIYIAVNSTALVAWAYCLVKSIKGLSE